jgi:hypothetical protein
MTVTTTANVATTDDATTATSIRKDSTTSGNPPSQDANRSAAGIDTSAPLFLAGVTVGVLILIAVVLAIMLLRRQRATAPMKSFDRYQNPTFNAIKV